MPIRLLYSLIVVLVLTGCPVKIPSIITETKTGEEVREREIGRTGSRSDVPVGKKPRQVVAQAKFTHGTGTGYISITKGFWPWSDVLVFTNCTKCHAKDPINFEQPKEPWWKWPAIGGSILALFALAYFWSQIKGILFFWRKL